MIDLFSTESFKNLAETTALEILSKKIPIESISTLNEPIDLFVKAKDVPNGLEKNERVKLKSETDWPESVINNIRSTDEAHIYQEAGLVPDRINDKDCLVRNDIDFDQKDEFGFSNLDRMKAGKCPISKDGQNIELHHVGQHPDSPLAELTTQEHRGVLNDSVLHDKTISESEINRTDFRLERESYWKSRAISIEGK